MCQKTSPDRTGHVLWHDELLCNLTEGRMVGKPTRGRRRLEMLEDLYENNSYEVLKRGQQKTEVHGEKARERKCQYLRTPRYLAQYTEHQAQH